MKVYLVWRKQQSHFPAHLMGVFETRLKAEDYVQAVSAESGLAPRHWGIEEAEVL